MSESLPKALRRQVARYAEAYLSTLVVEAMTREGLLDPETAPDRVELARAFLGEAASLIGGMQKGPFVRYVISGDADQLNDMAADGQPVVTEVKFESRAELDAFNSGVEDFDGYANLEVYDKRAVAEARVQELLGPAYAEDEFAALDEDRIIIRMGWAPDTVNGLRKRYIDEDRHRDGSFVDWIRALAREEEAECAGEDESP